MESPSLKEFMNIFDVISGCREDVKDAVESVFNKSFAPTVKVAMTALKSLENQEKLSADVKNRLRSLKLEFILMITTFRCKVTCATEDEMQGIFSNILARIQFQFVRSIRALDCVRCIYLYDDDVVVAISNLQETTSLQIVLMNIMKPVIVELLDWLLKRSLSKMFQIEYVRSITRPQEAVSVISNVQENIASMKPDIVEAYFALFQWGSPFKCPMNTEFVVQFIYFVIDTLEILLRSSGGAYSSWKFSKLLLALKDKLRFLENFVCFVMDIGCEELKEILIEVEAVADMVACLSYFLWINIDNEVKENIEIKKLIHPTSSRISAGILKTVGQFDGFLPARIQEGFFICLQNSLIDLLKDESMLKAPLRNQIETLHEQLKFLQDVFISMPILFPEKNLTIRVGTLARRVGSIIYSSLNGENMATEISSGVSDVMECIKGVKAEVGEMSRKVITRQKSKFPKILPRGFLDFLVEDLEQLISIKSNDVIIDVKDQFMAIHGDLDVLNSSLHYFTNYDGMDANLYDFINHIMVSAYEAEHIINTLVVGAYPLWYQTLWFLDFKKQMKLTKTVVEEMIQECSNGNIIKDVTGHCLSNVSSQDFSSNDVVAGVQEDQVDLVRERLAAGTQKLAIVSIVGMPGLGKTTLAKRLYNDPLIVYHFYVRGWCYASPYYEKSQMLLSILSSVTKLTDEIRKMKDEDLSEMLYKQLKGKRYLIVMDDIWGIDAIESLGRIFPDDGIGSRILFTSRSKLIGSEARYQNDAIELRLLTDNESWDLLKAKVFDQGLCPLQLHKVGHQIAQKCNGLPLAVVVVAGLLAKSEKTQGFWEQVSENLSSHFLSGSHGQGIEALELSYKLLPHHLKPLFLYIGAFPLDRVIPVRILTWLWTAEGFVQKTDMNSLEEEAERMLMDLIGRSLVMVADRKYNGRVKTCHMHDLLRDFCLAKAKEENFLKRIRVDKLLPDPLVYEHMRVSIHASQRKGFEVCCCPTMRSLLLSSDGSGSSYNRKDEMPKLSNLKLLRVLDSECECLFSDQERLLHLKYFAIWSCYNSVHLSVFNHRNLETLIVNRLVGEVVVPPEIWKMAKLRHLHINKSAKFSLYSYEESKLLKLETFSTPSISHGSLNKIMGRTPNLRKLRCIFLESRDSTSKRHDMLQKFVFPDHLESLKILHRGHSRHLCEFNLPPSLKKLTISKFRLQWDAVSGFQKLANLEVLKLVDAQVDGESWDVGDGEFLKLKVLKMDNLSIKRWNASCHNFPCLEQLIIQRCWRLVEIPCSLGDICTLRSIVVQWCSPHAAISAMKIEQEQMDNGNELLNIQIYPPHQSS